MLQAGLGHALADAALLDEVLLEAASLLVEQVVGLMDQADGEVRQNLGRAGVHEGPVEGQIPVVAARRKEPGWVFLWGAMIS